MLVAVYLVLNELLQQAMFSLQKIALQVLFQCLFVVVCQGGYSNLKTVPLVRNGRAQKYKFGNLLCEKLLYDFINSTDSSTNCLSNSLECHIASTFMQNWQGTSFQQKSYTSNFEGGMSFNRQSADFTFTNTGSLWPSPTVI